MRKIFIAAFAFAGLIAAPAVASARPPAVTVQVSRVQHRSVNQSAVVKARVEASLAKATADLNRGQRLRLVTAREATALRAEIRTIGTQLRQSLRSGGQLHPAEAARLERSTRKLEVRVAEALRPNRRNQVARR